MRGDVSITSWSILRARAKKKKKKKTAKTETGAAANGAESARRVTKAVGARAAATATQPPTCRRRETGHYRDNGDQNLKFCPLRLDDHNPC